MSYVYQNYRHTVFSEEGSIMLLKIRDAAKDHIAKAGAVRCDKLLNAAGAGDTWSMLACVDRLVEMGDMIEIPQARCAGQHRIFTKYDGGA